MTKIFLILLSVSCILSLLSCGQTAEPTDSSSVASEASDREETEKDTFSFTFPDPISEVSCGETVEYTAHLVNNSGSEYTISHGIPLIGIYIYPEGEEPQDLVFSTLVTTEVQAGEQIDKSVKITFDEAGEYKVRAFCGFSIDGEEYSYAVEYAVHVS